MNKKIIVGAVGLSIASIAALGAYLGQTSFGGVIVNAEIDTSDAKAYGTYRFWLAQGTGYNENFFEIDETTHADIKLSFFTDADGKNLIETYQGYNVYDNTRGENSRPYFYLDVDASIIEKGAYFTVTRMSATGESWSNTTPVWQVSPDNAFQVLYIWNNSNSGQGNYFNDHAFSYPSRVDSYFAGKALESINSCSASPINGYMAIEKWRETFAYSRNGDESINYDGNWKLEGTLSEVNIVDFANGANWQDGEAVRDTEINAQVKYDFVNALYEAHKG